MRSAPRVDAGAVAARNPTPRCRSWRMRMRPPLKAGSPPSRSTASHVSAVALRTASARPFLDLRRPRLTVLDVHNAYGVLLHLDADPGPPAADVEDAGIKALDQALEHVTRA